MNGLWVLWVARDNGSPWEQSTFKDHSAAEDAKRRFLRLGLPTDGPYFHKERAA